MNRLLFMQPVLLLFDMVVITDVVTAVAIETVTTGAIPELQLGIADVRSSADSALVIVGCFDRLCSSLIGAGGGEGNGFALRRFPRIFAE